MDSNKDFLGTEPVGKLLFKLSVPTVVAQLINMLYNIVDRIYIGHMPGDGTLALTGVGVCMPIIMLVSAFAALVGSGGAPRASIAMGQKNPSFAEKTMANCFTLQLVISAVLTVVLLFWSRPILMTFGATEETIGYAVAYLQIYAIGTVFVQLTLGMNAFVTAQGFTKTSMLSVVIGAVTNIILDPIFIFGLHMGVRGAALATVLSQALSCTWVLVFLFGRKTVLKLRVKYMGLKARIVMPCVALGMAAFIMQGSESVISVCFNTSLRHYGGNTAVGAMTILTSVMMFAMLPLMGLAQGAQPITSYNYGAGNSQRVRKSFWLLTWSGFAYSALLWAAIMLFPGGFARIFSPDPVLIEFTAKALRVYAAGILIFGIQMGCQMTFTSLGYAKQAISAAVVRKFVLLLPLIYIVPHLVSNPTMGVYMAEPIADFLAVIYTASIFAFSFKKAMAKLENQQTDKADLLR